MNLESIKNKNTELLSSFNIEIPNHLPLIESIDEVNPRTAKEVASRLCAISYVLGLGFGAERTLLKIYLEGYKLMDFVSDYEKRLLEEENISEQDVINMTWLTEAVQSLAWCLGIVGLDNFKHCDDNLVEKIPLNIDPNQFINEAKVRPIIEIQEQADLLYRMHWYARNCRLIGKECNFSEGIVSERRKAIDWVYGVEENWDEIPMDT